jgi:hypothetical protein
MAPTQSRPLVAARRTYLQFVDAEVFFGIGGFAGDTRKSDSNRSNSGPEPRSTG